jgi:hypothetical protein
MKKEGLVRHHQLSGEVRDDNRKKMFPLVSKLTLLVMVFQSEAQYQDFQNENQISLDSKIDFFWINSDRHLSKMANSLDEKDKYSTNGAK